MLITIWIQLRSSFPFPVLFMAQCAPASHQSPLSPLLTRPPQSRGSSASKAPLVRLLTCFKPDRKKYLNIQSKNAEMKVMREELRTHLERKKKTAAKHNFLPYSQDRAPLMLAFEVPCDLALHDLFSLVPQSAAWLLQNRSKLQVRSHCFPPCGSAHTAILLSTFQDLAQASPSPGSPPTSLLFSHPVLSSLS